MIPKQLQIKQIFYIMDARRIDSLIYNWNPKSFLLLKRQSFSLSYNFHLEKQIPCNAHLAFHLSSPEGPTERPSKTAECLNTPGPFCAPPSLEANGNKRNNFTLL